MPIGLLGRCTSYLSLLNPPLFTSSYRPSSSLPCVCVCVSPRFQDRRCLLRCPSPFALCRSPPGAKCSSCLLRLATAGAPLRAPGGPLTQKRPTTCLTTTFLSPACCLSGTLFASLGRPIDTGPPAAMHPATRALRGPQRGPQVDVPAAYPYTR